MSAPQNDSHSPLGDQELQILQYVTDNAPVSVRAVMAQWGEARGLARTTILTMLERLRLKGFLTRKKQEGVWVYAPTASKTEVLQNVVRDFVQKTLGGQIAPFVAYLTETRDVSGEELARLKQLVRELEQPGQTQAGLPRGNAASAEGTGTGSTQSTQTEDTQTQNTRRDGGGGKDADAGAGEESAR